MEDDINCVICIDKIENNFCVLNCGCKNKLYHIKCINDWFRYKNICPTCKHIFNKKTKKNKLNIYLSAINPEDHGPSGRFNFTHIDNTYYNLNFI